MEYQNLKNLQFLQYVRDFYRKCIIEKRNLNPDLNKAIVFYANFLKQLTFDYWENQNEKYQIYEFHFHQSYFQITSLQQTLENFKEYTEQQLYHLYDKLIQFYQLEIKSDFLIAFSVWYVEIYQLLTNESKKDFSDIHDQLKFSYASKEILELQNKLKLEFSQYKIIDVSYMMFYDLFYLDTLKQKMLAGHQLLNIIDEAFLQLFKDQYNQALLQQNDLKFQLNISKKASQNKEPVKTFQSECFNTIMQMKMKNPNLYFQFLYSYLKS